VTQASAPDQPSGPEKTYFRELNAGNFQIQLCEGCDQHVFYPRAVCPHCGSGSLKWVKPCGRGTVYSTTVVRRKPDAGGDYNVALINLEEGPRLMSRVEGIAPADVKIGMAVQAALIEQGEGNLLIFRPQGDQA